MELKLYVGIGRHVTRQDLGKRGQHRRPDKADVEPARLPGADAARLMNIVLDATQRPAGTLKEGLASSREPN